MRCSTMIGSRAARAWVCAVFLFLLGAGANAQTTNKPPTISGTPATWVFVGSQYSFTPTASDPERATLRFTVANKPAWATFSTSTGRLYGTPQAVGIWDNIKISVSDGKTTIALKAFSVRATSKTNKPPTIAGTPSTSATVGTAYAFQPTTTDPDKDPLRFSITNRPVWASFSAITGRLSGTPSSAHAGTYSNIVIRATDGSYSAYLPAFSITVRAASTSAVSIGGATLSWTPPTQNSDGTVLTNLAGYHIHYGTSATMLTHTIEVPSPGITTYVIDGLAPGTYYFAVRAYTSRGVYSDSSNVATWLVN